MGREMRKEASERSELANAHAKRFLSRRQELKMQWTSDTQLLLILNMFAFLLDFPLFFLYASLRDNDCCNAECSCNGMTIKIILSMMLIISVPLFTLVHWFQSSYYYYCSYIKQQQQLRFNYSENHFDKHAKMLLFCMFAVGLHVNCCTNTRARISQIKIKL